MGKLNHASKWLAPVCLLLFLFTSRLNDLTSLPLHNDEGLHLTRAVPVWNFRLFWDITDGKIINHWLIALFYPQNAPVFAARYPNVLVALLGLAAGYALLRHQFGGRAAVWGGIMWITAPYLFFYERLAQSDAQAGATIVVAVWAALLLAKRGGVLWAVLTGVMLTLAVLLKFTAAPYAAVVALVVLSFGSLPYLQRVQGLLIGGGAGLVLFGVPVGYLLLKGIPMFEIALGWLSNGSRVMRREAILRQFVEQLLGFGALGWLWTLIFSVGLGLLVISRKKGAIRLLVYSLLPLALIVALSSLAFPRHYIVAVPLLLLLSGAGWGWLVGYIPRVGEIGLATLLIVCSVPFMLTAYSNPAELTVTEVVRMEYMTTHSAGYGLREAVQDMPELVPPGEVLVASMFPPSCRRANFYAQPGYELLCTDAPGLDAIEAALDAGQDVYVLVEHSPGIGVDVDALNAHVDLLRRYPRPGETEANATVALYYIRPL